MTIIQDETPPSGKKAMVVAVPPSWPKFTYPALTHRPDIDHPKHYDWRLGYMGAHVAFKG